MREIERYVMLQVVDSRWRSHLDSMDYLRDGIHLRAMAQKDPLVEYRAEGHCDVQGARRHDPRGGRADALPRAGRAERSPALEPDRRANGNLQYAARDRRGADAIAAAGAGAGAARRDGLAPPQGARQHGEAAVNEHKDVGRNDPCWCGSGKKFKRCHGA